MFCKMHDRIPFFLTYRSPIRRFQMPSEGLSFVKTLVKFGIIYAPDPLLQKMSKIVDSHSIFLAINPCRPS